MTDNCQIAFQLDISILELDLLSSSNSSNALSPDQEQIATTTDANYVTRVIDKFKISQGDIHYRAEGNANIVLTIPQRSQVLRLPKSRKRLPDVSCSTEKVRKQDKHIFQAYKYIECVSTFFGPNASRPFLVKIIFGNINAFNIWLRGQRPLDRIGLHEKIDDYDFSHGLLYHDACSLNLNVPYPIPTEVCSVLAVEIKPKQGWNICSLSEWLLDKLGIHHDLRSKCRYCAMQFLKVKGQQVGETSKYCPLDLFSGDVHRMKRAIRNLIDSPQNNFRVFQNGNLQYSVNHRDHDLQHTITSLFGNNINNTEKFISLLVNILQYDFVHSNEQSHSRNENKGNESTEVGESSEKKHLRCEQVTSNHLPKKSILNRVFELQLLTQMSIVTIAQKYCSTTDDSMKNPHTPSSMSNLYGKLKQFNHNTCDEIDYGDLKTNLGLSDKELYEIGATALDCSIMLTMQRIVGHQISKGFPQITLDGEHFIINATVFDMDPKPYLRHYLKYVQKTRDSYEAYKQHFCNLDNC